MVLVNEVEPKLDISMPIFLGVGIEVVGGGCDHGNKACQIAYKGPYPEKAEEHYDVHPI